MADDLQSYIEELLDTVYFDPEEGGPFSASLEPNPGSKTLLVTGDNASGKSFLGELMRQSVDEMFGCEECIQVSMKLRAEGGIRGKMMWGGEDESSTGHLSLNAIDGAFRTSAGREHDHVLLLDEPDTGLGEGYAAALGEHIAMQELSERCKALVVVTHSRPLASALLDGAPCHAVRTGDDQRPTRQWIDEGPVKRSVEDLWALRDRGNQAWKGVRRIVNARKAGPRNEPGM